VCASSSTFAIQIGKDIPMDFVDKALARRLEAAEEMPQVHYARFYQKLRPEIGAEVEAICGGHMIFAGLDSPIGRTVGMGFDGSATAADLDRMENFYRSHAAPSQIDVCPLTDPPLLELLKQRGYTVAELNNVLFRRVQGNCEAPIPDRATIRAARADESKRVAEIIVHSFFPEGNAPENFAALVSPMYEFEEALPFVAEIDNEIVACACGLVISEHKIVALFGAATLPQYRQRGLHAALHRARLQAAEHAGCEFAVVVTQGGTVSQRNAERLGFRVAYSKATLVKPT
jgi:predicted N-acetyltransferase YhbS